MEIVFKIQLFYSTMNYFFKIILIINLINLFQNKLMKIFIQLKKNPLKTYYQKDFDRFHYLIKL